MLKNLLIPLGAALLGFLVAYANTRSPRKGQALPFRPLLAPLEPLLFTALALFAIVALGERYAVWAAGLLAGLIFGVLFRPGSANVRREQAELLVDLAESVRQRLLLNCFLDALISEYRGPLVERLKIARVRFEAGHTLGEALGFARALPAHAAAALCAAEAAGGAGLADAMDSAARDLRQEAGLRARVGAAILYPLGVWLFCLPLAFHVHLFTWPTFSWMSKFLLWHRTPHADLLNEWSIWQNYALAGALITLLPLLVYRVARPDSIPLEMHSGVGGLSWLGRHVQGVLPLWRARWKDRALARSTRALAGLARAGVPLHRASALAAEPLLSGPYAPAWRRLGAALEQGRPFEQALAEARLPCGLHHLALSGAATGRLPEALDLAAEFHESRAQRRELLLSRLIPVVTLPLVGCFVACFYVPVFLALSEVQLVPVLEKFR